MTAPIVVRTGGAGAALASIGQTIGQLADPDKEKREAFEAFLVTSPEALPRLGQVARENPALFDDVLSFLPQETREAIAATPSTIEQEIEGAGLTRLVDDPQFLESIAEFAVTAQAGTDPKRVATLGQEIAARLQAFKVPGVAIAGATRDITGALPGQIEVDALNEDLAIGARGLLAGFDGTLRDRTILREMLEGALVDEDLATQHLRRLQLAAIGASSSDAAISRRAEEGRQQQAAIRMVEQTNVGVAEDWESYLFNPAFNANGRSSFDQVQRGVVDIAALSTDPIRNAQGDVIGPSMRQLHDMAAAQANRLARDRIAEVASQNRVIDALITDIERNLPGGQKALSRSARQIQVERLNFLYAELNAMTDGEFPVTTAFITRNGPLQFLDENGDILQTGNPNAQPAWFNNWFRKLRGLFPGGEERPDIPEEPAALAPLPITPAGQTLTRAPLEERQTPGAPGAQSAAEQARAATELSQAQQGIVLPASITTNIPEPAMFTPQQIDVTQLTENTAANLTRIAQGQPGFGFKELIQTQPESAINILRAFRIQSPQITELITMIENEVLRREEIPDNQ